ncbi:MAG: hypothetical protein ACFFGZ_12755 [Candidatus Thorarchaeota archaeon]
MDGDSFSNAIPLVVDETQNRFIADLGADDDYWVIRLQNQLSPLILLNTSVSGYFDNFTVNVYDNRLHQVDLASYDSEDPQYIKINQFQTTYFGDYYIVVSYNVTRKGNYKISIFASEWGHSVDRPNRGAIGTIQTDFFSFEWMSETRYWLIPLNETQRCWLRFQETSPNVLEGTKIRVFRIPTNVIAEAAENGSGTVELTFRALGRGNYFIELIHDSPIDRAGEFKIYINATKEGYSFETSLELFSGTSLSTTLRFGDPVFFSLYVRDNSQVFFIVRQNATEGLENAHIVVYDPARRPQVIFYEGEQPIAGTIRGNFTTSSTGTYFIVVEPINILEAQFSIEIERIRKAPISEPLEWRSADLLLVILSFLFLPILLSFAYWYKLGSLKEIWEATSPLKTCFEFFAINESYKRITTTPYTTIDLVYFGNSSPIEVSMQFEELTPARTRIIITRKKNAWDILLGMAICILFYFMVSITAWIAIGDDLTPFNASFTFYLLLLLLFLIPLIIFLLSKGNIVSAYLKFKSGVADGILRLSEDFSYSTLLEMREIPEHIGKQYRKKIHQARRTWNHAKHDFRAGKRETFIIKADAAVNFVLEARVLQTSIYDIDNIPSEFMKIVESLREKGFDVPSRREIELFRNVRNRIVHSAGEVDNRTFNKAFEHYSKFLNRLGLRP